MSSMTRDPGMLVVRSQPLLYRRLHAFSFELRRLNRSSSELLEAALIGADSDRSAAEILRSRLVWPLEDIAVVEKCNAVIVVATVSTDTDPPFVRDVLLDRWLEVAPDVERVISQIEQYSGVRAIEYLGEVAVGLRSVVLGDGQVHSQVVHGLRTALGANDQRSPFSVISRRLAVLREAVRSTTPLQEGNTSLERVAVERLTSDLGRGGARVAIVGYGRTGRLLTEILSKDTSHDLVVTNRTAPQDTNAFRSRLVTVPWNDFSLYAEVDAVLICVPSTTETRNYVARIFQARSDRDLPFVLDMSSPSITRQIATSPGHVVHLDELVAEATGSLKERQRGINKARQAVEQWAEVLASDLASSVTYDASQSRAQVTPRPESTERNAGGRAQMLGAIRAYMAEKGFLETQTRCLTSTGRPDGALRRSIRTDTGGEAIRNMERFYEVGPVWSPDASWAPAGMDETYMLAAGIRQPTDVDLISELTLGLIKRVEQTFHPVSPSHETRSTLSTRQIDYETAISLLHDSGYAVTYGSKLDFDLLRNMADAVRFETGERLMVLVDCPGPSERLQSARHPKTGLARSFRIVLDGWQVASGSLLEVDQDVLRRRTVLAGVSAAPIETGASKAYGNLLTGAFEVALDHLVARCVRSVGTGS